METAGRHTGHCLINLVNVETKLTYKIYGEQDKSGENTSKSLLAGFRRKTKTLNVLWKHNFQFCAKRMLKLMIVLLTKLFSAKIFSTQLKYSGTPLLRTSLGQI